LAARRINANSHQTQATAPCTALCNTARANKRVESSVGNAEFASLITSGINGLTANPQDLLGPVNVDKTVALQRWDGALAMVVPIDPTAWHKRQWVASIARAMWHFKNASGKTIASKLGDYVIYILR
jgi:hypothetical protein